MGIKDLLKKSPGKRSSKPEDLYRVLFEQAADGIFVSDEKGQYVEVNERSCEMLGYSREEILDHNTDDFIPEEERREKQVKLDGLKVGQKIAFERNLVCKSGRLLPVEINVRRLSNGNHLAIIRDITERKQSELAITQVLEWQEAIFEGSRDAVFLSDAQSHFVAVNNAACELTGYPREELLTMRIPDLHEESDLDAYNKFHERIMAGESALTEAKICRKDGTKVDTEFSNTRVSIGGIFFMHTVARDITERRRAEQVLKREEEKGLQLERQLIQSQKFEGLGALASGIAHDFNNILNIIIGYAGLLKEHPTDRNGFERGIDAIELASQRGSSLVKQLLTLARKDEMCFHPICLNDIVKEICRMLRETLPKTIVVSTDLQKDIPNIVADASQLHQVFMNLCVNARDAMPRGGGITVSTSKVCRDKIESRFPKAEVKEYVLVQVSDTGTGMNDEVKKKIFEPFFTTKGPGKGTGLGLTLVYSIVENHRGMIEVDSEQGKGTTFSIYLPVDGQKAVDEQDVNGRPVDVPGGTETILVIEDEDLLAELVNTILVTKGYTVLSASDGEEGVSIFKIYKDKISVVITDLGLPKLSGDEVVRKIKSIDPESKIILSSGFIDGDIRAELFSAGASRFILKPYKSSEVLQTVRDIIDDKK